MKILVIHNNYQNVGGEDIAVKNEVSFLKKFFEVETLYFHNNNKNLIYNFFSLVIGSNFLSNRKVKKVLDDFNPDMVYVHNTWFKAGLGLFKILEKRNIKTVVKLHNFRYFCTKNLLSSNHFGNNKICQACGLNRDSQGILNKYFQESFIKSLVMINYGKKYFKILYNGKNKIFVLTKFHKTFLEDLGIDSDKISVFPNNLNFDIQNNESISSNSNYIVYAGRVSDEKGVQELIQSFLEANISDLKLKIVGNGPSYIELTKNYKHYSSKIEFLGELPNSNVIELILNSKAVVTATKLYEGQPTLLCEASSLGIPSIFPNTGGINEFFPKRYNLSFEQYDYEGLKTKLMMIRDTNQLTEIGIKNKNFLNLLLDNEKMASTFNKLYEQY